MSRKLRPLGLSFVLLVAACGGATPTPAPASVDPGSSVAPTTTPAAATSVSMTRFAEFAPVFHPVEAQSNQYALFYLLFDTLVTLDLSDPSLQTIVSDLAETWEVSPDASVFTFTLADGVTWHDGEPFTADDVVYTATWAAQNQGAHIGFQPAWFAIKGAAEIDGTTDPLEGVRKIDDRTVEFTLAAPNALFLRNLADAPSSIMPEHILAGQSADEINQGAFKNSTPVGTGPYTMVRVEPDQFVEFAANPTYFKGAPQIGSFFYKAITPETALAQLESGELDIALNVGSANKERLGTVDILNVQTVSSPGIFNLLFTAETPEQRADPALAPAPGMDPPQFPFHDKRVRQAFYYGIDRRAINDAVYGGANRILWNPPGFKEYPGLDEYPFDVDKAKALLAEAAADGADITKPIRFLYANELGDGQRLAPIVQEQLQALGLTVELNALDIAAWEAIVTDETQRDTWDMTFSAGGSEGLHPDRSKIYYLCEPMKLFSTGYYDCDLQDLWSQALQKGDAAEQDAIYEQIATSINENVPQLYLWQLSGVHVANQRVGGGFGQVPSFERYVTMNAETWTVTP